MWLIRIKLHSCQLGTVIQIQLGLECCFGFSSDVRRNSDQWLLRIRCKLWLGP